MGWIDLNAAVWTMPGERIKAKEPHRIPLSITARMLIETLKQQRFHGMLVFPSPRGTVLSDRVLTALLRRVNANSDTRGRITTAHGFRSSLRDWASAQDDARH